MTVVTPTDRPKSIPIRCAIGVFFGVFVVSLDVFASFYGMGAFIIGLSQTSSFFLYI